MEATPPAEPRKSLRSADFRYIPCDALTMGLSDNGVKIIFGVEEMDGSTLEMFGVHMTHKTAAILLGAITQAFDHYKNQTGIDIPIPDVSK